MARPLSLDLRVRVAAALADGLTVREAAKHFGVSVASAVRMGQLARAGHGLAARKIGGNRPPILLSVADALTNRLAAKSDWTLRALAADLRADGVEVSHDTVWRFMRRQGLTFKKNSAGKRNRSAQPGPSADTLAHLSAPP